MAETTSQEPSALLELRGVTVRFGGLVALDDVALKISPGEIVGLIGPNGAGKSTLVNVLTGVTTPKAGNVAWDGAELCRTFVGARRWLSVLGTLFVALCVTLVAADIDGLWRAAILKPMAEAHHEAQSLAGAGADPDAMGMAVRPKPGAIVEAGRAYLQAHVSFAAMASGLFVGAFVAWALLRLTRRDPTLMAQRGIVRTFQNLRLFDGLTVREHLAIAAHAANDEAPARIDELLEKVGLAGLGEASATSLAYGQMRRLELARAVARNPRLLLLDEPAAGLGVQETALLCELLRSLRQRGVAILLIEHDMELVMSMCDRVVVLDHGQKIAEGTPEEIRAHPEVIRAYLGTAAGALASHAHRVPR